MVTVISVAIVAVVVPVHGVKTVVAVRASGVSTTIMFLVEGFPLLSLTVFKVVNVLVAVPVQGTVVVTTGTGHAFPSCTLYIYPSNVSCTLPSASLKDTLKPAGPCLFTKNILIG